MVGLDGATITWKTIDDDWNESTTVEFDQKVEHSLPIKDGSKLVLDADLGDIVVRTGETDQFKLTIIRRVRADSRQQAEQFLALHTLAIEENDGTPTLTGHFQRREQNPGMRDLTRAILNGTVVNNRMPVSKAGRDVQKHFKRVLYKIGIPREMTLVAESVRGDVAIGAIKGDLRVGSVSGQIRITSVDGNLFVDSTKGCVEVPGGCTGDVEVKTVSGDTTIEDVGGSATMKSLSGSVKLARVQGKVLAEAGGVTNLHDCSGEIDVLSRWGSVIVAGATGSARIRASSADVLLDRNPGKIFVQTSGGDVTVNELPGELKAHTQAGSITLNLTENPAEDVAVSSRRGDIRLNVAEELAEPAVGLRGAQVEVLGELDAGVLPQLFDRTVDGGLELG